MESSLFEALPTLSHTLGYEAIGDWPTPLEPRRILGRLVLVKREDLSARLYGGNKIRPIEMVFGAAKRRGIGRVWATGAYGSNHALATVIHAPHHGLQAGAILWPQPPSATARANLLATVSSGAELELTRSIASFPARAWARRHLGSRDWVMPPGAATPLGALGHASAAIEVARQVAALGVDSPATIVLPAGSTCTTVGLIVGTSLVKHLGLGFSDRLPVIHAVRVTPWPVTSARRIAHLAVRTGRYLSECGGPALGLRVGEVLRRLVVIGAYIGPGYGRATAAGLDTIVGFTPAGPRMDTTYAAKTGAYLLDRLPGLEGPVVLWSTKSSAPLPRVDEAAVSRLPRHVQRWLARAERAHRCA